MRYTQALLLTPVLVTFVQAIVNMLFMTTTAWTLLLYLNHIHLTTSTDLIFYFRVAAIPIFMPAVANIPVAYLGTRFGHARISLAAFLLVAVGYILIISSSSEHPYIFVLGYSLYALNTTFRVIFLTVIADVVPSEHRTSVMACLQFVTVLGALFGPALSYFVQTYRGHFTLAAGAFLVDRFTILYLICALLALAVAALTAAKIDTFPSPAQPSPASPLISNPLPNYSATSSSSTRQTTPRNIRFLLFTFSMTSARLLFIIMQTTFQPALVTVFGATDMEVTRAYLIIALTATLPPTIVAVLARHLTDHSIIRIGLVLKLCGLVLYMPFLGRVHEWQVVVGFVLVVKASAFFTTACISAFTKTFQGNERATMMGCLWSISNGVVAMSQVLLGDWILKLFGKIWYGVYGLPLLLTTLLIWQTRGWELMNEEKGDPGLPGTDEGEIGNKTSGVEVESR